MELNRNTVELVLYTCLGYKEKETVLVVTDEGRWNLGWSFYKIIQDLGIEVILTSMKSRLVNGEEPPECIAQALQNTDIALLVTTQSLSHTQARRVASACPRGVRIASMPGADAKRLDNLLNINYDEMMGHGLRLAELLENTREVQITTAAGTNLVMQINGRKPHIDSGILKTPGAFGNLPAGEVYLAPLEGTTNGVLVLDGSMSGIGRLAQPIKVTVENGVAVEIDSEPLRKIIDPLGPLARNIAELGIGTNPQAQVVGNTLEDEKAINTVHIALGDNLTMGGTVQAPCHLDGVMFAPTIKLDGKLIPEKILKGPYPAEKRKLTSDTTYSVWKFEEVQSSLGSELYHILFDDSNDPQYILDFHSQIFLEVNPAFLVLSGYTREELVGKLKTTDLTPPETQPVLLKKIESREKGVERERYEFKMLTKSGEIRPIELSVHRLKLGEREVTMGSVRDITERLNMERALREKITEIAVASNRLMALTEKIKNVPVMTTLLLKSQTEEELCEEAIKFFCDPTGLRYQDAAIYFIRGSQMKLIKCRKIIFHKKGEPRPPERINLTGTHRFARVIRGELPLGTSETEILLPIRGLKHPLGLIRILPDPKEKELMKDNLVSKKGMRDIMETIATILGLLIESIRLNKTLEFQSIIDELTRVYNRRYFERMMREETDRAKRYRRTLSLMLLDLNRFKEINDTAGHKQGDIILAEFAHVINRSTRKVDVVCRYGGDEFAIILPETNLAGALKKANSLYKQIKLHRFTNIKSRRKPFHITASFGVSSLSEKEGVNSEETLLASADRALYQAKWLKGKHIKTSHNQG